MRKTEKQTNRNIPSYLKRLGFWGTMFIIVAVAFVVTIQEVMLFRNMNIVQQRSAFSKQREFIRDLNGLELDYIHRSKQQFEKQIALELKENVYHAWRMADSLYVKFHGRMNDKLLKDVIIQAVSGIRSLEPSAYVFINSLDGQGVFYPNHSKFTGKNMLLFKDSHKIQVVNREIKLLKTSEEGYLWQRYPQSETKDSLMGGKVTFVRKFKPYNWYFGSKCYLGDYYSMFKDRIARKISSERFRYDGYVFLYGQDGQPIVMNGKRYQKDSNLSVTGDSGRYSAFNRELTLVRGESSGRYLTYRWPVYNDSSRMGRRLAYVRQYPDYGWIVGVSISLDEMHDELMVRREDLGRGLLENSAAVALILILALSFEVIVFVRFNQKYNNDIQLFSHFFKEGRQNRYVPIPVEELHFDDFQSMGRTANEMIAERERVFNQLVAEQKKAKEADHLKTAFLANMSHEIRTPMNAIIGFSELLSDESLSDDDRKSFIPLIQENGEILLALINDIIDIAKIESNQLSVYRVNFCLNKLLAQLSDHYRVLIARENGGKVGWETDIQLPDFFSCCSDEWRLKQVLDNLIGNAIKFTECGIVRLSVWTENQQVWFRISDTGMGIPPEDQKLIFERFRQGKNQNSPGSVRRSGTGLGLAISKNIVHLLGGIIQVKSIPGEGAEFYFSINYKKNANG